MKTFKRLLLSVYCVFYLIFFSATLVSSTVYYIQTILTVNFYGIIFFTMLFVIITKFISEHLSYLVNLSTKLCTNRGEVEAAE